MRAPTSSSGRSGALIMRRSVPSSRSARMSRITVWTMNSRNMIAMPGRTAENTSARVTAGRDPAVVTSSDFSRMSSGSRYFEAAMTLLWAFASSGPSDAHGNASSGRSIIVRIPLTSSPNARTAPERTTASVFTASSATSGRNCSAGFFTTVSATGFHSIRSSVKRSGTTIIADALPAFMRSRPSDSPMTVTSNISFIRAESKAPRSSFEATLLSRSTTRTAMRGSAFAPGFGPKTAPMSAVIARGIAMKTTMTSGARRCRRTSFVKTWRRRRIDQSLRLRPVSFRKTVSRLGDLIVRSVTASLRPKSRSMTRGI